MATQKGDSIFARRVRSLLKDQNVTQKKLCKDLDIQEGSFSRYMREGRTPRSDKLADIANYLHTTSDYLLGREDGSVENAIRFLAISKDSITQDEARKIKEILDGINKDLGY